MLLVLSSVIMFLLSGGMPTAGRNKNPFHCAAKTHGFSGQVLTELGKWSVLIITPIRQLLVQYSKNYPNVIALILAQPIWQEI
jgi:hypothetical protein